MKEGELVKIRDPLEISKILYNDFSEDVVISDYIIQDDGSSVYRVVDIYLTPKREYDHKLKKNVDTDKTKIMIVGEAVESSYGELNKTYSMEEWTNYGYSFYRGDIDKLRRQVLNELVSGEPENIESEISNSTEIAVIDKDLLRQQKSKSIEMKNILSAKHAVLKKLLNDKLDQMHEMQNKFMTVITRINKVIYTLEIYLGVNEDIVQIQEGENASVNEPIHFRQKLLFMDTEMADPYNDGIDYEHIDKFENWLLAENSHHKKPNYQISIPEEKCVVAFRVREKAKDRDGWDPLSKAQAEMWDNKTYVFIRNGTNIYSIWANINIYPRLFPQRDEFLKELDHWEEKDKEKNILKYKLQILLMQGLIERTPIFQPLSKEINLFDPLIHENNLVKFVYDDEASLTDGAITYKDWKKSVNENIKEGSRVIVSNADERGYPHSEFIKDRLWKVYYSGRYNVPPAPNSGIYTVYKDMAEPHSYSSNKEPVFVLKIMYNPEDNIHNSWDWYGDDDHVRKNRLSFRIQHDDEFIVHWDGIEREDVEMLEKMIWDRRNRKDYLDVMPTLIKIIELKKKEIENEDHFIRLVYTKNVAKFNEYDIPEKVATNAIQDAVEWWKLRNKWKRSLDTDDAKAFKMISERVLIPSRLKKIKAGINKIAEIERGE